MHELGARLDLSRSGAVVLGGFGLTALLLFPLGYRIYPFFHTILNTGLFLVAGVLALLLWDMGTRIDRPLLKPLAISFAVSCLFQFLHAVVEVEWFGALAPITSAQSRLRPATWPPAAYILPIGIAAALWGARAQLTAPRLGLALLACGALLLPAFFWLPRYTLPVWLGVTRPTLLLVPVLWALVGWGCWRRRAADRLLPSLTLMAGVLAGAHVLMVYSSETADTPAMAAHLIIVAAYLTLLFTMMRQAATDTLERSRAEHALEQLNLILEQRVSERTAELEQANLSLQRQISVRLLAEAALRASHERARAIFDSALDGIVTLDSEGCISEFNPAAEGIFQQRSEAVVGRELGGVILPAGARGERWRAVARYLATGEAPAAGRRLEIGGARADGSAIDLELSLNRMPGPGAPVFAGFVRDITERKQAELKLETQLSRLDLLNSITRAIGERLDLKSILQVVVRNLEDNLQIDFCCICLYDASAGQLTVTCVGVRSAELALELAMTEQAVIGIEQNGLGRCVQGHMVYEPDIGKLPFPFPQRLARGKLGALVIAPLLVEGSVFGVLVAARAALASFSSGDCEFLRQLSEHVALAAHQAQLHAALQQSYDELRRTQQIVLQQERLRALGQMASGIAHDINNAISPVALYTESLLETEPGLSPRARSYLETIQRAIDDVAQTVARMREFYRQQEPQMRLAPVRLNRLVEQVLGLTRVRWQDMPQRHGAMIELATALAPELPLVMGVESEIREALINLVFNAVDAMPEGGRLTLRTRAVAALGVPDARLPGRVCVEVADTGIGMDEDTRRRCLEPFFTTKGERGTGLGLAMVYGVAQRHKAEIEIESWQGAGSVLRLLFPAARPVEPLSAPATLAYSLPPRLRLLVIDDDPVLLKSLRNILETDGHLVTTANAGQQGIDAFDAAHASGLPFAAVVTDLGMPYVDGRQVALAIKRCSPATPVILLTGWGTQLLEDGTVPAHVDHVLSKPPKLRELRAALAGYGGAPPAAAAEPA